MENIMYLKGQLCIVVGIAGSFITTLFGGWSEGMTTLLIFMIVDYISGLAVAGVFHKSKKTDSGTLESRAGWKGLCKKVMTLILVLIAHRVDLALEMDIIQNAVVIGFITNEFISIIENAGLMGLPLPAVISKAIDLLTDKSEEAIK